MQNFTEKTDIVVDLSHLACITVTGANTAKFLQGQLTCHLDEIQTQQSRLGAHCDPKGRIQMTFRLLKYQETYQLYLAKSMVTQTVTALQKYALFFKTTLQDISSDWMQFGLSGPHMSEKLAHYNLPIPSEIDEIIHTDHGMIIRVHGIFPRFIVAGPRSTLHSLWQTFSKQLITLDSQAWKLLDIMAGIPTIYPETIGKFTPHHINYHLLKGVSFNKGCYTGQEIIARMHYLGKIKQHLYRLSGNSIGLPGIGTTLFSHQGEVGTIIDAAPAFDQGYQLLAVLPDSVGSQPLYADPGLKEPLFLLDLPLSMNHTPL